MELNTLKPRILVYRDMLLPFSETFIPAQVESLSSYIGFYTGTLTGSALDELLPQERTIILERMTHFSLLWRLAFKLSGFAYSPWIRKILKISPVLIHAHFGPDGVWSLPLARQLNVPLLVTFHGYDITVSEDSPKLPGRLYKLYLYRRQQLFEQVHLCIAVSDFIRNQLLAKGCPPQKVVTHYIGIDLKKFQPDSHVAREPIVLFVGRLIEKKGCEYLLRAMALVQFKHPDAELVVIGDGPLRASLEAVAAEQLHRYRFLGAQPPNVVRTWMNKAQVLSVPSIIGASGNTEGLGMVFLEAQAMGLPVVSFAVGGVPEAVLHQETGFLVAERDINALSQSILRLMQDPALWQSFSQRGQTWVQNHFDLHTQTRKLESIYDAVLSGKKPGGKEN